LLEFNHRHFMKKKDAKQLLTKFSQKLKIDLKQLLKPSSNLEQAEILGVKVFFLNGEVLFAEENKLLFPTLAFHKIFPYLPKIVVDMGAVPYVCQGADVMAPGVIRTQGDFNNQDFILVVDERHKQVLAVAIALLASNFVGSLKHGKVAKNIHYVGDKLWNILKQK